MPAAVSRSRGVTVGGHRSTIPSIGCEAATLPGVWAPGFGFVGVGEVTVPREPITEFKLATDTGEAPAIEALTKASYHREFVDDPDKMEYFIPVKWLHVVPLAEAEAVNEIGLFGNQNPVCKPTTPRWRTTVERLKERWGI